MLASLLDIRVSIQRINAELFCFADTEINRCGAKLDLVLASEAYTKFRTCPNFGSYTHIPAT